MANETNKDTEILEFKVEQGAAITELEKLRKTMVGLKEEQAQLTKAYKQGDITIEEYSKEITRVDTLLKKVSTSHNQAQKAMAGVQTETSKLIKSNQQLAQTFKDSASQVSVAGVNIGQLTSKIQSLANPVTAAVAVVGALGAAYARSTLGAKDLAFAQNQLSSALTMVTNDFARLITSAEDGEGAITKVQNFLFGTADITGSVFGPFGTIVGNYLKDIGAASKEAALAAERLEDLQREEIQIRGEISERLSDNQELLTKIGDEQTPLNEKTQAYSDIIGNLRKNQTELVGVLERQRDEAQKLLDADTENEALQTAVLQKNREIEKAKSDTEKRIQAILRQEDNLLEANKKQLQLEREKTSELERQRRIAILERFAPGTDLGDFIRGQVPQTELQKEFIIDQQVIKDRVELTKGASAEMGKAAESLSKQVEASNKKQAKSNDALADSTDAQRDALRLFSSEAARLYQTISRENKFFAAAQLAVDAGLTLSGIQRQAAGLDARQAGIYRAAALLSAGASLAQAARLIGTSAPGIENLGPTFTATGGQQFVIQNGKAVPIEEAQAREARRQQRSQDASGAIGAIATGAAIGSAIPGIGTVAGAVAGGLAYGAKLLFNRLFRRRRAGYASGGWTGPGEMYDVAGVVHADEYVAPKKVVNNPAAQPHLKALENMRVRGYANGGYTAGPGDTGFQNMVAALSNIQVFASITDINRAEKRNAVKMAIVTK